MASTGQDASIAAYRSIPTDDYDAPFHSSIDNDDRVEQVKFIPRTPMERQVALQAALEIDPGVQRFSRAAIQVRMLQFLAVFCLLLFKT